MHISLMAHVQHTLRSCFSIKELAHEHGHIKVLASYLIAYVASSGHCSYRQGNFKLKSTCPWVHVAFCTKCALQLETLNSKTISLKALPMLEF
jgi:hypothetical protein